MLHKDKFELVTRSLPCVFCKEYKKVMITCGINYCKIRLLPNIVHFYELKKKIEETINYFYRNNNSKIEKKSHSKD
jgi:hypothetical protein